MARKPTYEELENKLRKLEKEAIEFKQEQEILKESEKKYREYVETMNEGLGVTDENYFFTYVNKRFSHMLGYSREEMLGRHITEFVAEDYQRVINEESSKRKRGEGARYELVWNSKGGQRVYTLLSPKGLFDPEGLFKGSFGVLADITALKQTEARLRESEGRYRDLYQNAPNAYFSISATDGSILRCNTAALRLLGYDEKTILKMNVFDLYADTPHGLPKAQEFFKGFKAGESTKDVELELKHKDGHPIWISLSVEPVLDTDGKVIESRSMVVDITDRKLAEETTKKSSEKIKLFAYSVSHDLKSPAVAIYGVTRLLQKHYVDAFDERGRKYCETIRKAAEQIDTLVGQINEYISTKEVPLSIERINLKELFRTVKEEFSHKLHSRQIKWREPEYLPEINADRLSALRAIRNLVDNALKYGGEKLSKIEIGYHELGDYHILSVKDDGIGLREEEHEKLFAAFVRKETSRGIAGAGIGLSIVKEIVETHKGQVWLESNHSSGMTFYMSISKYLRSS